MDEIEIGDRRVSSDEATFVIAEAGSNHNGDKETALKLIDAVADAGADAVKFQTFKADRMYPEDSGGIGTADSDAYSVLKELEMSYDWIPDLTAYADERGLVFLSSPFDRKSADALADYVSAFKIGSSLVSHHPFLEYVSDLGKPLIISTGAHSMEDIAGTMDVLENTDVAILQCVSAYPTPLDRVNVSVIKTFRDRFDVPVGLSDHTEEPAIAPAAAVALDAAVIEKHLTLDNSLDGPDHSFALEPAEFEQMVSQVRCTEAALGDGQKVVLDIESETYENGRRCLHASRPLREGEILTKADIEWLRPGENPRGISPTEESRVLGSRVTRDIDRGETIAEEDIM